GAGSIALAHWAMLTLVFPLSHYRAPAIPALAILAAGAIAAVLQAEAGRRAVIAAAIACIAAATAVIGAVSPQPGAQRMNVQLGIGGAALRAGDYAEAEMRARAAIDAIRADWGIEDWTAWHALAEALMKQSR